jgi:hypothetical protein
MKKNKSTETKPQSALNVVIILIVSNLIIYLYVIGTGVNAVDLLSFNQSRVNDYLIIGSYFILTFAMLITIAVIFNVSAYIKRLKTNDFGRSQDISTNLAEDNLTIPQNDTTEDSVNAKENIQSSDNKDHKQIESKLDTVEKKLPEQNINALTNDTNIMRKTDKEVPKGWKKIGIKLDDLANEKPEAIVPDKEEIKSPDNDIMESDKSEVEEEQENLEAENLIENQNQSDIDNESEEILTENPEEDIDNINAEDEIISEVKQYELENSIDQHLMDDSEVIKNLEEVKMMVDEMKITLEKRKISKRA